MELMDQEKMRFSEW